MDEVRVKRRKCVVCNGAGETYYDGEVHRCEDCHGKGHIDVTANPFKNEPVETRM
jgi:DnaJ-class molecular chaperone